MISFIDIKSSKIIHVIYDFLQDWTYWEVKLNLWVHPVNKPVNKPKGVSQTKKSNMASV